MFKKLFYKLMLLTLVGMLVAPFILKRENGTTIMTMDEFLGFDAQIIADRYSQTLSVVRLFLSDDLDVKSFKEGPSNEKVTKLYKWKDKNGEWHFSDVQDENYQPEVIQIYNDRNILKFEDLSQKDEEKSTSNKKETEASSSMLAPNNSENKIDNKEIDSKEEEGMIKGYLNNMKSTVQSAREVQSQVDADYQRKVNAIDGSY